MNAKPVAVKAGDDDAVHHPAELPSAEQEDQQHGRRLRALLDHGGDHRRPQGVGARRVGRRGGYPARRERVGDDRDERGGARAPGEGEQQIPPGPRLDPVQPAEGGHQERHRKHRQAETDEEPLRAGLLPDEGQDHQPAQHERHDHGPGAEHLAAPHHADAVRPVAPSAALRRGAQDLVEPLLVEDRDGGSRLLLLLHGGVGHLSTLTRSTDTRRRRIRPGPGGGPSRAVGVRRGRTAGRARRAPCPGPVPRSG